MTKSTKKEIRDAKKAEKELDTAYYHLHDLKDNHRVSDEIKNILSDAETISYLLNRADESFLTKREKRNLIDIAGRLTLKSEGIVGEYIETCRRTYCM